MCGAASIQFSTNIIIFKIKRPTTVSNLIGSCVYAILVFSSIPQVIMYYVAMEWLVGGGGDPQNGKLTN